MGRPPIDLTRFVPDFGRLPDAEIAHLAGCCWAAVARARKALGIAPYSRPRGKTSRRAAVLAEKGVHPAEIARRLGVSRERISQVLKRPAPARKPAGRPRSPLPPTPAAAVHGVELRRCSGRHHPRGTPRELPATLEHFPRNITAGGREILRSECHACYRRRQAEMYRARKARAAAKAPLTP